MIGQNVLFSHNSDEWETPQELFDKLDREFHFSLDACASDENHKCDNYYTIEDDGLDKIWDCGAIFCNPPYSQIAKWVEKCYREGQKDGTVVVMLIPARTDTRWFHKYVYHRSEIRFLRGRLKFSGAMYNAPFPSMVVVFRGAG